MTVTVPFASSSFSPAAVFAACSIGTVFFDRASSLSHQMSDSQCR